jgi:hypothetical protein
MKPCNDRILIETLPNAPEGNIPYPERSESLQRARIVEIGSPTCIVNTLDRGLSVLVKKADLIPDLAVGLEVLYLKMAEDRTSLDAAYSIKYQGKDCLLIKINDIYSTLP